MEKKTSELTNAVYPRLPFALFNKLINLTMSHLFKTHGHKITREQEVILRELCRLDGANQVGLALRTGQDRNNLSRTLTLLEGKGLILRDVCDVDKRNSRVYITEAGRQLHEQAFKTILEYQSILFKGFNQREINHFSETIQLLIANLSEFEKQNHEKPSPRKNPCVLKPKKK